MIQMTFTVNKKGSSGNTFEAEEDFFDHLREEIERAQADGLEVFEVTIEC